MFAYSVHAFDLELTYAMAVITEDPASIERNNGEVPRCSSKSLAFTALAFALPYSSYYTAPVPYDILMLTK